MTNLSKLANVAEGKVFDCSECPFNQTNPDLKESCQEGLLISRGIAKCNATDEEAGMQEVREGAAIEPGEGGAGVLITYDEEGLLLKSQYRVRPNLSQKWLARIGINKALWHPEDI